MNKTIRIVKRSPNSIAKEIHLERLADDAHCRAVARRERLVDALLDAAFRQLQHDTGPTNPEYIHQQECLKCEFAKILNRRKKVSR